jgi:hypothetical protein
LFLRTSGTPFVLIYHPSLASKKGGPMRVRPAKPLLCNYRW